LPSWLALPASYARRGGGVLDVCAPILPKFGGRITATFRGMERRDHGVQIEHRAYADVSGVHSLLIDSDERLWCAVKETYAVALIHRGRAESRWWRGAFESGPGTLVFNEPGSVYKDLRRDGPARFQIVSIDPALIRDHPDGSDGTFRTPVLQPRHPDRRALLALQHAYNGQADGLTRQVVVAEAIDALVRQLDRGREPRRARGTQGRLRRAADYIHAHLGDPLTLADLAAEAGLDRFHFCRAFREEYGVPPYAYALRARIARARGLLVEGTPVSVVSSTLGFCDQSQLNRHFRRLMGLPPGVYARRAARAAKKRGGSV